MTNINPNLAQAREWAKYVHSECHPRSIAAAEVIRSLPDYSVDAEKVRDLISRWGQRFITPDADMLLRDLRDLLPTLADTEWDDDVHPYMEARTVSGRRHTLLAPMGETAVSENTILVAEHDGGMPVLVPAEYLFPTGRYARLVLPDESLAITEDTPTQQERVVTEDDYRNAPTGTVVWGKGPSSNDDSSMEKYGNIWLEAGDQDTFTPRKMSDHGPHEVLRWGDVS